MNNLQLGGFAAMGCEDKDGIQIVSVSGEVDLYSAHRLRELIWRAKRQAGGDPPRMVVDLSGVEFIDTAGLEVLLEEWNATRQFDRRLCLVAQQGPITRLFEVTGLSELFDLYAELDAAVESCALAPAQEIDSADAVQVVASHTIRSSAPLGLLVGGRSPVGKVHYGAILPGKVANEGSGFELKLRISSRSIGVVL